CLASASRPGAMSAEILDRALIEQLRPPRYSASRGHLEGGERTTLHAVGHQASQLGRRYVGDAEDELDDPPIADGDDGTDLIVVTGRERLQLNHSRDAVVPAQPAVHRPHRLQRIVARLPLRGQLVLTERALESPLDDREEEPLLRPKQTQQVRGGDAGTFR